jgi:hypothetical protein
MTDPMAPPAEPCECYCLHCNRVFMSSEMWFQRVINASDGFPGFWMCPTPNCSGAGYCFDIFPTDPSHPDNEGWVEWDEDDEDEDDADGEAEWDPEESRYKALEEEYGEEDDDIEGEEWKYGLTPGEAPQESEEMRTAREAWEAKQRQYDQPDERPRVLDWKDKPRPEAPPPFDEGGEGEGFREEDIPF